MNGEDRNVNSAGDRKPGGNSRLMALLLVIAFVGGALATGWAMTHWHGWKTAEQTGAPPAKLPPVGAIEQHAVQQRALPALPPANPQAAAQALSARVAELEDRLSRINVEAQAASGNAARAEGLLVAFAARRALDNGAPLGYIEGQLRLRFGQAQPRAVATIINASREPVTLEDLRGSLEDLAPALTGSGPDENWWNNAKREVGQLFVIRDSATPSPLPEKRLQRARSYLQAGRVDAALAEVSRMPGRAAADRWMQMARRYNEARRALDLIETAAILEPRELRATNGDPVEQSSPLAP